MIRSKLISHITAHSLEHLILQTEPPNKDQQSAPHWVSQDQEQREQEVREETSCETLVAVSCSKLSPVQNIAPNPIFLTVRLWVGKSTIKSPISRLTWQVDPQIIQFVIAEADLAPFPAALGTVILLTFEWPPTWHVAPRAILMEVNLFQIVLQLWSSSGFEISHC